MKDSVTLLPKGQRIMVSGHVAILHGEIAILFGRILKMAYQFPHRLHQNH